MRQYAKICAAVVRTLLRDTASYVFETGISCTTCSVFNKILHDSALIDLWELFHKTVGKTNSCKSSSTGDLETHFGFSLVYHLLFDAQVLGAHCLKEAHCPFFHTRDPTNRILSITFKNIFPLGNSMANYKQYTRSAVICHNSEITSLHVAFLANAELSILMPFYVKATVISVLNIVFSKIMTGSYNNVQTL